MTAHTKYRGFSIEKIDDAVQMNYNIAFIAGTLRKTSRRIGVHYVLTYPDSEATKTVKTMKDARRYIDEYLG